MTQRVSARGMPAGESSSPEGSSANHELASALCEAERDKLVAYLRRSLGGNHSLAEDMAQEAMVRIAQAARDYLPERARGLLYTIARHLLADHFRAERAQAQALQTLGVIGNEADTQNPLRQLVAVDDVERIRAAIVALPPRCRQVFVLNRYENMSYPVIAKHCGISVSMVEKHISRALRSLMAALEDPEPNPSGRG